MSRKQKGSGCGDYVDPALEYRHCGNRQNGGAGKTNRKQKGGQNQTYDNAVQLLKTQYEVPSDVTNTYLSEKTSELTSHWANPSYPARGGSRSSTRKQKGGQLDYPFESQYNEYPIPSKMSFPIDEGVSTNFVSNKDMFACQQKGGSKMSLKSQKGNKTRQVDSLNRQNGGDCACNQPISLGGAYAKNAMKQKKQRGSGFGYNLDVAQAITNRPEVVRYSTEGTGYYGKAVGGANKQQRKQKGGSAASDSLMEYFLDFQHRCRNTEIY